MLIKDARGGNVKRPRRLAHMCWQCERINQQIRHYHGLSARVSDKGSIRSLEILIAQLEADKDRLHPVNDELPAKAAPPPR
jgi:hypothetical protein